MTKLIEITGKALTGEWGTDDETGEGIPVLRTTNFTNKGVVDYSNVVTRTITKNNIDEKFLRSGDIIIEKSGGSDKYPVGRVIYFDGPSNTYLFNNFTGLLRVRDQEKWFPKYVFYSLYGNYRRGGTRPFENKTTGLHNLKTDDYVSRYEVTEADYSRQREICTHLDMLYSIIKMREEVLVKLDELIKARFVEMFGDIIINDRLWKADSWSNLLKIVNGKNQKSVESNNGKYVICGSGGIIGRATDYLTKENSVIIGRKGNINKPILMREKYWNVDTAFGVEPNENYICVEYLYMFCLFFDFNRLNKAVTIPSLTKMDLLNISMPIPDLHTQKRFATFVSQVNKSKVEVKKALDEAQLLFDSLMQKYFG